ncbi:MAG TPA: aminotransferase class I/II-fold pyridoxal phosphate-dependent enzyme [Bryobacteraceae bacterium]|nr:aminotransferase class I/II-fold pyridoxal phosphate-dependent enzyme [Bryobacteraceae bacterium]
MHRRTFLATAAGASLMPAAADQLAVSGGMPVRTEPLSTANWGPLFYDDKERTQLDEVLESRRPFRFANSLDRSKVAVFENEYAARMQAKFALAVTSGTAALHTALAALEVGPGDEVILPAWTWYSCYATVIQVGALPVFAEIDESFNLDPGDLERHITPNTRVIMAVHLQGNPADMDPILAIARKHKLKVLEDASQSVGASYKGRPLGSMGDIGIYSLQQSKTITAGEGGAVVTNDPYIFERAVRFHDVTVRRDFPAKLHYMPGLNYRMNEFTGGVLLAQVRKLDTIIGNVRRNAQRVYDGIRDLPGARLRKLPDPTGELGTGVFLEFRSAADRQRFSEAMKAEGVPVSPPAGSVILPIVPEIEQKVTVTPRWPSFASERGQSIRYGRECCLRTIDILGRFAGVMMGPKYTERDTKDAVTALRKVYLAVVHA